MPLSLPTIPTPNLAKSYSAFNVTSSEKPPRRLSLIPEPAVGLHATSPTLQFCVCARDDLINIHFPDLTIGSVKGGTQATGVVPAEPPLLLAQPRPLQTCGSFGSRNLSCRFLCPHPAAPPQRTLFSPGLDPTACNFTLSLATPSKPLRPSGGHTPNQCPAWVHRLLPRLKTVFPMSHRGPFLFF